MSNLPEQYIQTLAQLKEQIKTARVKVAFTANKTLLELYWNIGNSILDLQAIQGWGSKTIDRLSAELRREFPDFKGLSVRNLKYMVTFARLFPFFGQQAAAQNQPIINELQIRQQAAAQLPWGHLQLLMDKVPNEDERYFYLQQCIENGWSRDVLQLQIKSQLHHRIGQSINNFTSTLPSHSSDLVQQTIKNPYIFDFVLSTEAVKERDLENALIKHLQQFMLELGRGFAYVGRQKNLVVEDDDFFLDLLFYNYHLHCFVVIELKIGDFKPEYTGKLNFYVNAINKQLKGPNDAPTIGILLCRTPNETVVKYSLQGIENPIGVSEYEFKTSLPEKLIGGIPTVEELEAEVEKELQEYLSPADKKLDEIKDLMANLKQPKVQEKLNENNALRVLQEVVFPLRNLLRLKLNDLMTLFRTNKWLIWTSRQGFATDEEIITWLKEHKITNEFRIEITLKEFIEAGPKAFHIKQENSIWLSEYTYTIAINRYSPNEVLLEKLYHELPTEEEFLTLKENISLNIMNQVQDEIRKIIGENQ